MKTPRQVEVLSELQDAWSRMHAIALKMDSRGLRTEADILARVLTKAQHDVEAVILHDLGLQLKMTHDDTGEVREA